MVSHSSSSISSHTFSSVSSALFGLSPSLFLLRFRLSAVFFGGIVRHQRREVDGLKDTLMRAAV